jgi:hypothetical protein
MSGLARVYIEQGKYGEAEALYVKVLEARQRTLGGDHRETTNVLAALGELRLRERKYAAAEAPLRAAINGQNKNSPEGWERYDSQSMLGASLAAQARFVGAEPLLLSGYRGLAQKKAIIPAERQSALKDAGKRIVQLYRDWGKAGKAAEWQRSLQTTASNP